MGVVHTLMLSCAPGLIKYFSCEFSLSVPVVQLDFSSGLRLELASFTFVILVKIFDFFYSIYSSQAFLTLDFILQVALQNLCE